jgi:hypothetical protein
VRKVLPGYGWLWMTASAYSSMTSCASFPWTPLLTPIVQKIFFAMLGYYDLLTVDVAASMNLKLTKYDPAGDQNLVRT